MLAPLLGIALSAVISGQAAARDLKTTTGEVFHNFAVTKKEPAGLRIQHDAGVAFVDFILLSEADKMEFGFDAAAYAAWQVELLAAEKLRQQAIAAHRAAAAAAWKAAELANRERSDTGGDFTLREESQRRISTFAPMRQGVEVTVDTPGFSYRTYRNDGTLYFDGTQPGVTDRIRGYYRGDGSYYGPVIIRQR